MRIALVSCLLSLLSLSSCGDLRLVVAERQGDGGMQADADPETGVPEGGVPACAGGIAAFTTGDDHVCVTDSAGTLYCGGDNGFGQLGDGTTDSAQTRVRVQTDASIVDVEGGDEHTCAIDSQGALYCWGLNDRNQLGDGAFENATVPQKIADGPFVSLSVGFNSSCAIDAAGALHCWGANDTGLLGTGDTNDRGTPTLIDGGLWSDISVGRYHTCGIKAGALYCWGDNGGGQLGITGAQQELLPRMVSSGWREVSSGERHSCAIANDDGLFCWGDNANFRLGLGDTDDREVPTEVGGQWSDVAAGRLHTCGVREGVVYCWGSGPAISGFTWDAVSMLPAAIEFDGVPLHADALDSSDELLCAATDEYIVCWGENNSGELGLGTLSETGPPVVACPLGFL